jgi:hypothetical protein
MVFRRAAVSVTLFVLAAMGSFVLAGGLSDESTAVADQGTSTTSSTATGTGESTRAYFMDPHETLVATTAFVPVQLEIRDNSVNLDFDAISMAPNAESIVQDEVAELLGLGFGFGNDLAPVLAVEWLLTTTDGVEIAGTITNPEVTIVRFPTESAISADDIANIEITQYLVATPIDVGFTLSDDSPSVEVFPGATVTLVRTTPQDDQTIVVVDASTDVPIQGRWMHVSGDGPGWGSSVTTGQFGGGSWSLAWVGSDLPNDIPLRAIGTAWLEGPGPVELSLAGVK